MTIWVPTALAGAADEPVLTSIDVQRGKRDRDLAAGVDCGLHGDLVAGYGGLADVDAVCGGPGWG